MKERVYWTEDERETLRQQVYGILMKHPGMTALSALNRAQAQFTKERQRKIISTAREFWLTNFLKEKFSQAKTAAEENGKKLPPPPPPPPPDPAKILTETSTEKLLVELLSRLIARDAEQRQRHDNLIRSLSAIELQLRQLAGVGIAHVKQIARTEAVPVAPDARKRIVIVGLLEKQFRELDDLQTQAKMSHIDSGKWNKVTYPHGSHVVLMTKFISHSWQHVANHMGRMKQLTVHYVSGGLSELRQKLMEIIG